MAVGAGRVLLAWTWGTWIAEGGDVYGSFLAPAPLRTYCTGKTNSLGCVPYMDVKGIPSASDVNPFVISGKQVLPGEIGLLLYGYNKANLNYHGGKLCVNPFRRLYPAKVAQSTGAPPCVGVLRRDFNQVIQAGTDPLLTAGATVRSQWRQRDAADPLGFFDSLTDAVQFVVGP